MVTVAERNVWWEAEQPRFDARQRARFIDSNTGRSAVVVGTPEQFQASLVDVSYLTSVDEVRHAAAQDPDIVFPRGRAACSRVRAGVPGPQRRT